MIRISDFEQKAVKFEKDGLIYSLDEEEKKASVISYNRSIKKIIIPRSAEFNSEEYIVSSIESNAFGNADSIESIEFAKDTEIQIIKKNAFYNSSIDCFYFPSKRVEFEENWCEHLGTLNKIKVDPSNTSYIVLDEKYAIGKSNPDTDEYDTLILSVRNIKHALIPSFIKIIGPYAFNYCKQLESVTFSEDSNIEIIEKGAFSFSNLKYFDVPFKLKKICQRAFYKCMHMNRFEIPKNSELQTIEKKAFNDCKFDSLNIPYKLVNLEDGWCDSLRGIKNICALPSGRYTTYHDEFILGKSTPDSKIYDVLILAIRTLKEAKIPSFIKEIGAWAFGLCMNLKIVIFEDNSELEIIGRNSFINCPIKKIFIPPSVTFIGKNAFENCEHLCIIDIPENSCLETISDGAFYDTKVKSILIPQSVHTLENGWCSSTSKLNKITVMPGNENYISYEDKLILGKSSNESEIFDSIVFAVRDIKSIQIPDFITVIGPYSFDCCLSLENIEFSENSNLHIISTYAFYLTDLTRISLPKCLKKIYFKSFFGCNNLEEVKIPSNSELEFIGEEAFSSTDIRSFLIPPHLKEIQDGAFFLCDQLKSIQSSDNTDLKVFKPDTFYRHLEEITIPSGVVELGNRWVVNTSCLKKINVMPGNPCFSVYEDRFLVGKSSVYSEDYDILYLTVCDMFVFDFPSFIKEIAPHAFYYYMSIQQILFTDNSSLQKIGMSAFEDSGIEKIVLPPSVTTICERAFASCEYLLYIELPVNPDFQVIDNFTFCGSSIKSIFIPPNVVKLSSHAFCECSNLQIIEIGEQSKLPYLSANHFIGCKSVIIMASCDFFT